MIDEHDNERTSANTLRLLVLSSDTFVPTRVDVAVLFGEELAGRGHQIDWILQSGESCDESYQAEWGGGTVIVGATDLRPTLIGRIRKHLLDVRNDFAALSLCREKKYDIVQVKDKFLAGILGIWLARVNGAKLVYWLSWPFPEESLTQWRDRTARYPILYLMRGIAFKFLLYRLILPSATHVFVQSAQMRRDIAAEGIPPEKMTAVPMGVKIKNFRAVQRQTTTAALIPEEDIAIVYLGILIRLRRLDFLIRVLALVLERLPKAKLYLVGSGGDPSDERYLRDEAATLGVTQSVVFTGQRPWHEALRYVEEATVCVSPFYPTPVLNSTSPTKLVEYMAVGRPVVANDHPEQRLLIEESGAGLCVPWNETDFADAIIRIVENRELAERMAEAGPPYVAKNREYRIIADAVESEFRKIAEK